MLKGEIMKFKIKNDNYKNFDVFKDNVLTPRSYFIPFSSPEELRKTDIRTERYSSSMVEVLSGEWIIPGTSGCGFRFWRMS